MFLKYNFPTFLWATIILFLTLLPTEKLPELPDWELISFSTASHAVVFCILAVLMLRGFSKQVVYPILSKKAFWICLFNSIAFGVMIEFLQTIMGLGRQGDIMDIVSNSIGTVLGIGFYFLVLKRTFLSHFF